MKSLHTAFSFAPPSILSLTIFDCIYDYDCKSYQKWKCKEDIPCEYEKRSYHIKETEFGFVMAHSIGETVFLTREEAEKKLEEMKKNGI